MTSANDYGSVITAKLEKIGEHGLYRDPPVIEHRAGPRITLNKRELVNFCSNDYLGLAQHPRIKQAMSVAAEKYGVGSTASPLICGKTALHQKLEERICERLGCERALLFNCGYMANLAVAATMTEEPGVEILLDRLCHASIIDGVVATGKRFRRYPHLDLRVLEDRLRQSAEKLKLVFTESVFSMDGDIAPLADIAQLCQASGAVLVIDDAHGLGVLGQNGLGAMEHFNLGRDEAPLVMGTFGKALGVQGAFVAGKEAYIELLLQRARPYIYSTSMSLPVVAAVLESFEVLNNEPGRRAKLHELIGYFNDRSCELGFGSATKTPIQPVIIGAAQKTMKACTELKKRGLFVMGIRPPTVKQGTSRLRVTLSASHSTKELELLLTALAECRSKLGF